MNKTSVTFVIKSCLKTAMNLSSLSRVGKPVVRGWVICANFEIWKNC